MIQKFLSKNWKNNRQAYPRSQLLSSDGRMTRKLVHKTGAAFQ